MNVSEAISRRRAVRAYTSSSVDDVTINELLAAAVQAPSATNGQPWIFSIVQDRELLARWSEQAKRRILERAPSHPKSVRYGSMLSDSSFNIFYDAGTLIVIGVKERGPFSDADCWLAAQNLMLAACEKGLGTCCIGFATAILELPEVKAELGVPKEGAAIAPIIVGWPRAAAPPVPRNPPCIAAWRR